MTKPPIGILAVFAALALMLAGCKTFMTPSDNLVGTWYENGTENGGTVDLIWEFRADSTVAVHSWTGTAKEMGVYHHLQGDRVALDFDGVPASIVTITISANKMTMTKSAGEAPTVLEKK